eukprot:TRINITY_DN26541_c0_g1_i2.p2 TRINITY_DN26541_c0_g1~~TRINITY_DN26541_c0_g1_i2.p2  ORF type:complete len:101 (-),score=7.65 TRINITY_DN26541_c0_g1_i2:162-464(-)
MWLGGGCFFCVRWPLHLMYGRHLQLCWRKATRRRGPTAPETSPCDLDSLAAGDLVSASPSSPVEDLEAAPIDFDRVGRWVVVPTYYALVSYMFWAGADLM